MAEEVASILVVLQRHVRRLEKALEPLELRVRARESARVETSQQLLQLRTDNFTMAKHLKKEQSSAKQEAEERNKEKDEIRLTIQSFQNRLLQAEANPTVMVIQQWSKQSFHPHHPGGSATPPLDFFFFTNLLGKC